VSKPPAGFRRLERERIAMLQGGKAVAHSSWSNRPRGLTALVTPLEEADLPSSDGS
jgi:hypothetical protein